MTSISDTEVVNAPGGLVELSYVERTTSVTVSGSGSGSQTDVISTTIVSDGSPILIEFFAEEAATGVGTSGALVTELWVDGVDINRLTTTYHSTSTNAIIVTPHMGKRRLVLSAGTHTIAIKAWSVGGGGSLAAGTSNSPGGVGPMFLRVSKIIQASQLLVTQSNAPIVTSLPSGNLVTGQEVYLYTIYGYVRYLWDGSNWVVTSDNRNISFVAHGQQGVSDYQGATTGFYNFVFGFTTINNGSGYNSSNGRFTAPVTGLYHFSLNVRLDSTTAGGYLRTYIWRPDGGISEWVPPNLHAIFGNNHATDYQTISISGLRYLTAGQYVVAGGGHASGSSNLLRSESTFTGHLVK